MLSRTEWGVPKRGFPYSPPLTELLPDPETWRSAFADITDTYRAEGVFPAMGLFGSGEQMARRAAVALAERLGIGVTSLPGAHGGWGSDPPVFAEKLHEVFKDSPSSQSALHGAASIDQSSRLGRLGRV